MDREIAYLVAAALAPHPEVVAVYAAQEEAPERGTLYLVLREYDLETMSEVLDLAEGVGDAQCLVRFAGTGPARHVVPACRMIFDRSEHEAPDSETLASVLRGLAQSAVGQTVSLGSFAQYLETDDATDCDATDH